MIEIEETQPVEASFTLVLRGANVGLFKDLVNDMAECEVPSIGGMELAKQIREALS